MSADTQGQDTLFGNAVRMRRAQLGVTLDQLAGTSGVSAAALSRIERGLLSPTLRNAIAIARGLGCDLAELVVRDGAHITRTGENLRFVDEATGIERLALARPNPAVEILSYTVPAGARSNTFAAHKPGTREIFHLLSGQIEVRTAGETVLLNTGDTATLQVDSEHWFKNCGEETARIILTILGV